MTAPADPLPWRCAAAARDRGDDLVATAPPARRLLLVEVPGPWGRTALTESRLDHYVASRLGERAAHAGVRVLLVRRPGRTPPAPAPRRWALADLRPGREAVAWGSWDDPHDLMDVDLAADVGPTGPQRVALVCAHTRHDVCCALEGRPVAAALAADGGWDVWECSHLGGDRFAANVLLLPAGDLFGGLGPGTAADVVARYAAGRVTLAHWRGRYGRSPVEQAALWHAAQATDDDRRDAVRVVDVQERPGERWSVDVETGGRHYRLHVVASATHPHRLTCAAARPTRARVFELDGAVEPLAAP